MIPCWGWREGLADDVVFALNRWNWAINAERAQAAGHAIFSAEGKVVLVVQITGITPGPQDGANSIEGHILTSGPLYDRWIGQDRPIDKANKTGVNYVPLV